MYACEYLAEDSSTVVNAEAVSVDVHHDASGRCLDHGQLAELAESAIQFWPNNQVPPTLWQRVAREAALQIEGELGYEELAHWSPIALNHTAFGELAAAKHF